MILILPCEREIGAEAGTTGLGFLEIIIRIRNKLRHFLFTLFMFDLKWEETRVVIRNHMIVHIHHGQLKPGENFPEKVAPNTANTKQGKVLRNLRPAGIPVGNLHRAKCGVHRANLGKLHRAKLEPETITTKKTIKKMIKNNVVRLVTMNCINIYCNIHIFITS